MATEHLAATSLCDLFYEPELCPDEILTILQNLDDYNTNNIFNVAAAAAATPGPPMGVKNSTTTNNKQKKSRKKTAKTASSSLVFGSNVESDDDHAVLSQRKSIKRQKISPSVASVDDGSGEDGGGAGGSNSNGKVVSHIAVERNRRKQMNEHLAVLRQLMPCFYVKKGDQASIIGGVIDYINELQQVLRSLEAKKQRKIFSNEVGLSPRVASSPRLLAPQQHTLPISPRKPPLSPRPLMNLSISPRTPQSITTPYKPLRQPVIPLSSVTSPTTNSGTFSSTADMIMMMNRHNNYNAVANELVASSKSSVANVEVKFCGQNLELKTLSLKIAGQTVKMVSAIEDLSLEILQATINTVEEIMLNAFIIKIGIECQLSADELAHHIQQTFNR